MYPLVLKPTLKDYIWGGRKLKTDYNKQSDKNIVAESWELSCHKDGISIINNGELKGVSLEKYINSDRRKILGSKCDKFDNFPILVKLIDAKNNLSIQVHPDDEYAQKNEGQYGKKEMWYIIDCNPDSYIYYGLNKDLSIDEFQERIKNNTILESLNKVNVKKGDVFFIEPGTLHSICGGILLAEVQQNSNVTYRVYDYNRVGPDGNYRDLHINNAVEVANLRKQSNSYTSCIEEINPDYCKKLLSKCEYFSAYHIAIDNKIELIANGESFHCILCLNGSTDIIYKDTNMQIMKGQTVFIPAGLGAYKIQGACEILFITL